MLARWWTFCTALTTDGGGGPKRPRQKSRRAPPSRRRCSFHRRGSAPDPAQHRGDAQQGPEGGQPAAVVGADQQEGVADLQVVGQQLRRQAAVDDDRPPHHADPPTRRPGPAGRDRPPRSRRSTARRRARRRAGPGGGRGTGCRAGSRRPDPSVASGGRAVVAADHPVGGGDQVETGAELGGHEGGVGVRLGGGEQAGQAAGRGQGIVGGNRHPVPDAVRQPVTEADVGSRSVTQVGAALEDLDVRAAGPQSGQGARGGTVVDHGHHGGHALGPEGGHGGDTVIRGVMVNHHHRHRCGSAVALAVRGQRRPVDRALLGPAPQRSRTARRPLSRSGWAKR